MFKKLKINRLLKILFVVFGGILIFFLVNQSNFLIGADFSNPNAPPPEGEVSALPFVFKDEMTEKGVISFFGLNESNIPLVLHGSGAQLIGRNVYYDANSSTWRYYKDGSAYGILWGGSEENNNNEWSYMRFLAAPYGASNNPITFQDAFSITPFGDVKFYKNLIFGNNSVLGYDENDGYFKLALNNDFNINSSNDFNLFLIKKMTGSEKIKSANLKIKSYNENEPQYIINADANYLNFEITNLGRGEDRNEIQKVLSISNEGDEILLKKVADYNYYDGYFKLETTTIILDINIQTGTLYSINNFFESDKLAQRLECDKNLYMNCERKMYYIGNTSQTSFYDLYIHASNNDNISIFDYDCLKYIFFLSNDEFIINDNNGCKFYPAFKEFIKVSENNKKDLIIHGGNFETFYLTLDNSKILINVSDKFDNFNIMK